MQLAALTQTLCSDIHVPKDSAASKHALDEGGDIRINIKAVHKTVVFKPWMHADISRAYANMKHISSEAHVCILALELIAAILRKDHVLPEDARAVQCGAQVCVDVYGVPVNSEKFGKGFQERLSFRKSDATRQLPLN